MIHSPADHSLPAQGHVYHLTQHPGDVHRLPRRSGRGNALLRHACSRRSQGETDALLASVLPVLARASPVQSATLVVPARVNPYQALPADRVEGLAELTGTEWPSARSP